MSNMLRITGMASGLDVDSMVKSLMKAENVKLDKVKQSRQLIQWRQDLYRDILGDINVFKTTYLNDAKPESYMLLRDNYAGFDVASTNNNAASISGVTATAGAGAAAGTYTVQVAKLAKASTITGSVINETGVVDVSRWSGQSIGFSIDGGATENIQIDNLPVGSTLTDLVNNINAQITAKGSLAGKIKAVEDAGKIKFSVLTNSSVKIINDANTTVNTDLDNLKGKVINPSGSTSLSDLGMTSSVNLTITYNGIPKTVTIDNTKTINDTINAISTATSGNVIAKFSQLTGQFTLSTADTGSATTINIDKDISALGLVAGNGIGQEDATAIINGVTINKSTNTFSVDGITYNLIKDNTTNTVSVTSNTQKTYDKIKSFIDKYNEIIGKIDSKITEKTAKGYVPLTDDQKKEMKSEEITAWETKAKEGLLRGDSDLRTMLYKMRGAFFSAVQGAGVTLNEIGLDTSSDVTQGGKIIIDETKLKDAIKTKGDQVTNIFTKVSSQTYISNGDNTQRYSEEGIFQRINDIMKDYTRPLTMGGKKGILVEKAGIKGTASELNNLLTKQITDKDKIIANLAAKLTEKENNYYLKFSRLEQAMQKSNSQSAWISQQFGGGQ